MGQAQADWGCGADRKLVDTQNAMSTSLKRLSSGLRIPKFASNETQGMRQLAVQPANDTNGDRAQIQEEVRRLNQELDRISSPTQFNGKNLLDASSSGKFQIGAGSRA